MIPPALRSAPIVPKNTVHAKIEKVCPGKVVISGFIRKVITYTAVLNWGDKQERKIIDDIPFQCIIDREDANEGDSFKVTGATLLCEVFARPANFGTQRFTNKLLAYRFVEKDIIEVCIRKDC